MPSPLESSPTKYRSFLRFVLEGLEGLGMGLMLILTWPLAKRWFRNWGARREELERAWPGDALVSANNESCTRAVDVGAPSGTVWRWVLQFGLGRAGFYSYELLERLVGIPVRNVESIVPALLDLSVGDTIKLHPRVPGITIAALEPGKHLCFCTLDNSRSESKTDPARSWSIYLEPRGPDACRLLLRSCIEAPRQPSIAKKVAGAVEEPVDFLMEQRMLRTIRRLAESEARPIEHQVP